MSVMPETFQSAMGPYVAVAAVGLALYAWTAIFRAALLVKVPGGDGGDGGGDGGDDGGDWQMQMGFAWTMGAPVAWGLK